MKKITITAIATMVAVYGYSQDLPLTAGSGNPLTGDLHFSGNRTIYWDNNNYIGTAPSTGNQVFSATNHIFNGTLTGTTALFNFPSTGFFSLDRSSTVLNLQSLNDSENPYFRIKDSRTNTSVFDVFSKSGDIVANAGIFYGKHLDLSGTLTGTSATFKGTLLKNSSGNGTTASPFFDDFIDYRFISTGGNSTKIQFGNAFTSNNSTLMRFVVNGIGGGSDPISAQTIRYNNIDFSLPITGTSATFTGTLLKNSTGNGTIASPFFDDFIDYRFSSTGGNSTKIQFGNAFTSNNATLMRFVVNGTGGGSDPINAQTIHHNNIDFSLPITATSATFTNHVAIGTPQLDANLSVKGKIRAKEIKVELDVLPPDYVFEKEYDLRSLPEVEKFITENKHLPEIPSAKTMTSEGVNVGEMQMKLLQKIEELTLHLIEQDKKLKKQEQLIDLLIKKQ